MSPPRSVARHRVIFGIGVVMIGLGLFLALHPLFVPRPVTASRWLDVGFAFFFVLRGLMNVRHAARALSPSPSSPSSESSGIPPHP